MSLKKFVFMSSFNLRETLKKMSKTLSVIPYGSIIFVYKFLILYFEEMDHFSLIFLLLYLVLFLKHIHLTLGFIYIVQ